MDIFASNLVDIGHTRVTLLQNSTFDKIQDGDGRHIDNTLQLPVDLYLLTDGGLV